MQYINPCWQLIDGWSSTVVADRLATVIGVSSFAAAADRYMPYKTCVDRSGLPLSYFADVQAGWDWIYETVEGKKLISPANIYPQNEIQ